MSVFMITIPDRDSIWKNEQCFFTTATNLFTLYLLQDSNIRVHFHVLPFQKHNHNGQPNSIFGFDLKCHLIALFYFTY